MEEPSKPCVHWRQDAGQAQRLSAAALQNLNFAQTERGRRDPAVCCFVRLSVFPKPLTSPLKLLWPNKCDLALIISLRQVGIVRGVFPFRPSPLPTAAAVAFTSATYTCSGGPRQQAATSRVLNIAPTENQTVTKIT